ncbi:MAG: L-fuculokinase [Halocynthiibacter sp.]
MQYVVGLDLGSGSIRAAVFDLNGTLAALASCASVSTTPDPEEPGHIVWPHTNLWANTCAVLKEALAGLPPGASIAGVSVACLGMDGLPVDRNGAELFDLISWTDSRCVPYYERWIAEFGEDRQFRATGTPARGFSTIFRLQWMADHHPEVLERTHKWVLIGDYINMKFCGELATDYSMAASTLLFDPATNDWHPEIARAAGIDTELMCDPLPAGTMLGKVGAAAAEVSGLPLGTPVVLGGHDYLCGVLPVGGHKPGTIVNVGGTWDVIQTTLPSFSIPEAAVGTGMTYEPHVAPNMYSVFGAAIGGAVSEWFRARFLGEVDNQAWYDAVEAASNQEGGHVMFLPHFAGASGPVVDIHSSGAIVGLRSENDTTQVLSAVFEGLAFQTREILEAMTNTGARAEKFVMVGGSSNNPTLVQRRANILGLSIEIPDITETATMGAAMLAGLGAGVFADLAEAAASMRGNVRRYEPIPAKVDAATERFGIYQKLYPALREAHHDLSRY